MMQECVLVKLAKSYPVEADLVVGVPDSGIAAAMGYAKQSHISYGIAFQKIAM